MRKVLLLFLLLLILPTTAQASQYEIIFNYELKHLEKKVATQISLPHFDAWRRSNGVWQDNNSDGKPDMPVSYGGENDYVLCDLSVHRFPLQDKYILTKAVIKQDVSQQDFEEALKTKEMLEQMYNRDFSYITNWMTSWSGDPYKSFKAIVGKHKPSSWNLALSSDVLNLDNGIAVRGALILDPINDALDLVKAHEQGQFDPVTGKHFTKPTPNWPAQGVLGYRWYLPCTIEWYGVPKGAVGLTVTNVQKIGKPKNGKQRWQMEVHNMGAESVKDIILRAYIKQDKEISLTWSDTHTRWLPVEERITVSFETPVPTEGFELIATANLRLDTSGFLFKTVKGYPENAHTESGLKPENVSVPNTPPSNIEITSEHYKDNIRSQYHTGAPIQDDKSGSVQPNDLAVTKIEVLDGNKNSAGTTLKSGETYYVRVTCSSDFDVSGFARIRLYRYDPQQKRLYLQDIKYAYFRPKGTVTKDFGRFRWVPGSYVLIGTVSYVNNSNDPSNGWQAEKFNEKYNETTYSNNKKSLNINVGKKPWTPPQPNRWGYNKYYPPQKVETVPVYETYTEPVYGWKKVKFVKTEKEDVEIRVRLIE